MCRKRCKRRLRTYDLEGKKIHWVEEVKEETIQDVSLTSGSVEVILVDYAHWVLIVAARYVTLRDGCKTVHRRILYMRMNELGVTPDETTKIKPGLLGMVMGEKYHPPRRPHGDRCDYECNGGGMATSLVVISAAKMLVWQATETSASVDGDGLPAMRL